MESSLTEIQTKLLAIQIELKAPKNQRNSFGNYNYRSCEDILEAVKPLAEKHNALVLLDDEIVAIGPRIYVKATASIISGGQSIDRHGYAREEETKKGMDGSQITGAASSYARKYALNALFLIDDSKDSDSTNHHEEKQEPKQAPKSAADAPRPQGENKRFVGHIGERKEGRNGFVSYMCGPFELSTKNPETIAEMDGFRDNDANVQIDYTEMVNGRWTNRYIQAIKPAEELPF